VVLLDFGLASTKVDMRITTYGSAVGSALYMAPEQLDGRLDEVDARTDVYSLGVTLCELLTLQVPYSGSTTDEIKSAIARGAAPHLRARNYRISRDLENVCLKAIAGDRKLRYASMDDFAADLQRVLDDEPVLARPPSSAVRLLRWVRRHPTGTVAMLLAAVLVFVVPSALYLQQRVHSRELEQSLEAANVARRAADAAHSVAVIERERAQREARDSEVVTKFLVDTFGAANPLNNGGRPATAEELLRQGVERIDTELADQPAQRARLLERMAESFRGLGSYERAGEMAERAVALRRELHGDDDARTGYALGLVGINRRMSGASDQGIAQLTEALATLECSLGPAAPATIDLRLQLAAGLLGINRARDAHWLLERALHDLTVGSPDDVRTRARILLSMAFAQSTGMRWHELYATCCTLLDSETLHQLSQAEQLQTLGLYGGALRELDRLDEAIDVSQEALARAELLYGELHSQPAGFLQALSDCYVARGELQHALDGYRRAFEINLHLQGAEFPAVFRCAVEIVELEMALGRLDAAVRFAEDYSAMLHESLGPDHIRTQYMEWHCAMLRLRCGDVEDALERMLDLQPLRVAQDASVAPRLAGGIALCHWMLGDADAAYGVAYYASGPAPKIEMLALPLSLALAERGELASAITLLESITAGPVDRFTEEWALATCRVLLALLRDREQGAARPSAATTTARRAFERQFGTQQAVYGAIVERYGLD
jgi:tetratricopeptide (TPR) repeat protein